MIIEDYYKNNQSDIANYSMFSIEERTPAEKSYYLYFIFPMIANYNYVVDKNDSLSYLPSYYIEYKEKIFFIEQNTGNRPSRDLLVYLDSLKLLDSTRVKLQLGLIKYEDVTPIFDISDGSTEGVDYVICKETPYRISERIKTSVYIKPEDERFNKVCE